VSAGLPPAVVDRVRERLAARALEPTAEAVADVLRDERRLVGDGAVLALADQLRQESLGAGPLEPLLRRPGVTDVLVNGPGEAYVDAGSGLERVPVALPDEAAVRRLAQRLAALGGRRLDDASPYVDCRLPDGTRFHAVLAPVSRPGTVVSLRVPARTAFTLDELRAGGSVGAHADRVLRSLVERRLAFLVSGGTGSGKTTLLATLLGLVPPHERVVVVEDATELRPTHPHVVGLEARPANVEGAGEVTVRDLVRQALRMRPDRLVVGEVRGAEVVDLLAALNTGHEGGAGTLHANASVDVPARLEALALAAGLPRDALHAQLASAVDAVLHVGRDPDGRRRLGEVAVLRRGADGLVEACAALGFRPDGTVVHGPGWPWLEERLGWA
jgi:pilus assembly protein CpaF